jgi:hypothetical protein
MYYTMRLSIRRQRRSTRCFAAARDVTAQLLSNYSLSLIEASRDPLVTISIEGKITDMNEDNQDYWCGRELLRF